MSTDHTTDVSCRAWRVLLTGFGPFPGVADNISAAFARGLGQQLQARHPACTIEVVQLETIWARAASDVAAHMCAIKPDIVLLFGVSSAARGLVIERQAFNACAPRADAAGCLPPLSALDASETACRQSSLPVDEILSNLTDGACPVSQSDDAGRYLCNAVLFEALKAGETMPGPPLVGFIHLPVAFANVGVDRAAALAASERLAGVCIAHLAARG